MERSPTGAWRPTPTVIVAGNGPSLRHTDQSRFLPEFDVVRVNSFFFEEDYFIGDRADLVMVSGDPRTLPFYFATLKKAVNTGAYRVGAWTSQRNNVLARYRHRCPIPAMSFCYRDNEVMTEIERLRQLKDAEPTTGIYAILNAHGHGATRILLAGIDLYSGPERYAFNPGARVHALMGKDFASKGYDLHLHSRDLDLNVLLYLQSRGDCELMVLSDDAPLRAHFPLAPVVSERRAIPVKTIVMTDWEARAGWYPLWLLWLLRQARAAQRRVFAWIGSFLK